MRKLPLTGVGRWRITDGETKSAFAASLNIDPAQDRIGSKVGPEPPKLAHRLMWPHMARKAFWPAGVSGKYDAFPNELAFRRSQSPR
jgi:hypothetical protein